MLSAYIVTSVPATTQPPEAASRNAAAAASAIRLPAATVSANPRNAAPSAAPVISAEWAGSTGSKKSRCQSAAAPARSDAASPAVNSASVLARRRRPVWDAARVAMN